MSIFKDAPASVVRVSTHDVRVSEIIRDLEPNAPSDSQHALTSERHAPFRLLAAVPDGSVLAISGLAPIALGHEEIKCNVHDEINTRSLTWHGCFSMH